MKALLLSAGLGTRLKPLTDNIPKVMVPINGKPSLQYAIENLSRQGVNDFAINTHYMPEKIKEYFRGGSKFGVRITYSFEPEILGTAGALNNFRDFFDETFIIIYADVIANFDVSSLLKIHKNNKAEITIALDIARSFIGKGVVTFLGDKVVGFSEKTEQHIKNGLINSGFYIAEPKILAYIPKGFSDFGKDILPKLAKGGKVFCGRHKGYIFDIGTIDELKKAESYLTSL